MKSDPGNNLITDAVTQANPRITGEAPAMALGHLYMATAHALGEAVQNAVSTQQQTNILAQAATSQAVIQLLSINSPSNNSSLDGEKAAAIPQVLATTATPDALAHTIEEAIESVNKIVLDNAGPWSDAARDIMRMAAVALRELQMASQEANMAMVKQAAIAAALVGMIKAPDQLEQYQKILELAQGL